MIETILGVLFFLGILGLSIFVTRLQEVSSDLFSDLLREYAIPPKRIPKNIRWEDSIIEMSINNIPQRMVSIRVGEDDRYVYAHKNISVFTPRGAVRIPNGKCHLKRQSHDGSINLLLGEKPSTQEAAK